MLKEQKESEAAINHKNEDTADRSAKAPSNLRIMDAQRNKEMMNGIDNAAFESEQL